MKYIYITMVQLPTIINKYVTFITGFEYTHFSISFNENLNELYSFQLKNKKIPFVGGLTKETEGSYFQGKKNITIKEMIFKIPVNEKEYRKIFQFVEKVKNDKEYTFNFVSVLIMFVTGGINAYKSYHCTEFVSVILSFIKEIKLPKKTYKMHPIDLYNVLKPYLYIKRNISSNDFEIQDELFLKTIKTNIAIKKSLFSIKESLCRTFFYRTTKTFNYKNINFYCNDIKK